MNSEEPAPPDHVHNITGKAARSGGAMFVAKSVRFGFILIVNFILINLLVPSDFGLIRYVLLVVGIANLVNEMGLTTAIVQKEHLDTALLFPLFIICTFWGIFIYFILYTAAPAIARYFATPELTLLLRVGALMIPVTGITAVHRALLRRRMAFGTLARIESSASFLSAASSVILALNGAGVWALVAGYLVFEGVNSLVLLISCKIPVVPLKISRHLTPFLTFGIAIVGVRIIDYVLGNAPFFLIGKVIGQEGLGLFSVAHDIALFPQMAINAVLTLVLISTFSRVQSDPARTASGFSRIQLTGTLFSVPLLIIMALMPEELMHLICIFKDTTAWIDAAPLLRWLALMGIFYVFTTFSNAIWLSQGKIAASAGVSLIMCIFVIAAILPGARYGLSGIATALLIRSVVVFPLYMYLNYLITKIPVRTYFGACLPSLTAGAVMAGGILLIKHSIPGDSLTMYSLRIAGGTFAGITLYAGVVLLFFRDSILVVRQLARSLIKK